MFVSFIFVVISYVILVLFVVDITDLEIRGSCGLTSGRGRVSGGSCDRAESVKGCVESLSCPVGPNVLEAARVC